MSALLSHYNIVSVDQDIRLHPAWIGRVSGLKADKLLRDHKPFSYVLREGENAYHYYVTFTEPNGAVRHTPFLIKDAPDGWCCENGVNVGPFKDQTIDDVLHCIMHCEKEDLTPLV